MMGAELLTRFRQFLQNDLAIPDASLQLALRHPDQTSYSALQVYEVQ